MSGKSVKDTIQVTFNSRANALVILSSEANFNTIQKLVASLDTLALAGRRILIARARGSRDLLPESLRARGAAVEVVELYRAVAPPQASTRLHRLLDAGIDVVTLTSSSAARHLAQALAARPLPAGVMLFYRSDIVS